MVLVGVDFGATSIRAATVRRGKIERRVRIATNPDLSVAELVEVTAELVERVSPRGRAVGLGFCGMVDAAQGRVIQSTDTLPGWRDVPLASMLSRRLGRRVLVDNDGNCAALGEWRHGAGRGTNPFVMLTLGTGIGAGVVVDGRILAGAGHMAGKLGHLKVRSGGRRCACGARGCVEAYLSAYAFRRAYGAEPKTVFAAARAGDDKAVRLIEHGAVALGTALSDVAHALNPKTIAIGGGLSRGWPLLRRTVLETYERLAMPAARSSTRIVKAKLGANAGIIGAAELCRR